LQPGLVLAVGENGVGKTNLLEALHVGTQGFSPRSRNDAQLVRFGCEAARIELAGTRGPSRLEHLKQFALPGVATEAQAGPPPELPPGQKGTYFKLKIEDGTEWTTHVVPAGQLTAFLRDCPSDVRIALVVVFPEQR